MKKLNKPQTRHKQSGGFMTPIKNCLCCMFWILLYSLICFKCLPQSNEQIANAIYKAENSTKFPYGILSIDTHGENATLTTTGYIIKTTKTNIVSIAESIMS